VDDWRLRVCLDRTIELDGVRLHVRDWPGRGGPLVHVPDPLCAADSFIDAVAATLAPRYRVLSVAPRGASPYQVDATDLLGMLDQFGFLSPILVAERLGCVPALLVAAWHPRRVAGLVLVEPAYTPPPGDGVITRALKDCPPDWAALRRAVECPMLEVPGPSSELEALAGFLAQFEPGVT
jgi:pimeloyl-ACP methyl ester carboxylesterase